MPVITLSQAADFLRISPDERGLRYVVDGANATIEDFCRRQFSKERLTEYHDIPWGDVGEVWVRNPPIITLHSVTDNANTTEFTSRGNRALDTDLDVSIPEPERNRILLVNHEAVFTQGVQTCKLVYTGGYEPQRLPGDLVLAGLELAAAMWRRGDALVYESENVDGRGIVWAREAIPSQVRAVLERHMRTVL